MLPQGENNVQPTNVSVVPNTNQGAHQYSCMFPALIQSWRAAFNAHAAFFGFVQLSTWCKATDGIPRMRAAQMSATRLDMVGYASNADHGAGCNIHPPPKQYVGVRLGNSALALIYKQPAHVRSWRSPSFAGHHVVVPSSAGAHSVSLVINITDVSSELGVVYPYNYGSAPFFNCSAAHKGVSTSVCSWAALLMSSGDWVNASVSVVGRAALQFTAAVGSSAAVGHERTVVGSSYGWGAVPMLSVYDRATMLPLLPWNTSVPSP
eukprot:COSAG01_NODE_1156_length_11478_cov_3.862642_2_plen_264_part_00